MQQFKGCLRLRIGCVWCKLKSFPEVCVIQQLLLCLVHDTEMASDIPGPVTLPGAPVGAGQVRMAGSMPGRGGKRRSGG